MLSTLSWLSFTRDPLWQREWRATSRLARTPWLMAGAGLALGATMLIAAFAGLQSHPPEVVARNLYQLYFGIVTLAATFLGPAIAANSIALEREGKTWEALVMADLAPRAIDRGKFLGAYTHLALYLFALLPAAAIPHLLGSVPYRETILGIVMVFAIGALAVRFGLLMSAVVTSTRVALLSTVVCAALLSLGIAMLAVGTADWLATHVDVLTVRSSRPVFWPLLLVEAPLGQAWLRYGIVVPALACAASWTWMRALTTSALAPEREDGRRGVRRAFAFCTPMLALALALIPFSGRDSDTLVAQALFAIYVFFAIVVFGGERDGARGPLASSVLLLTFGVAGTLFIAKGSALFAVTAPLAWQNELLEGEISLVETMNVYAPAFMLFLVGAAAFLRRRFRRPAAARAILVGLSAAAAIVPLVASVMLGFVAPDVSHDAVAAFSPLFVAKSSYAAAQEAAHAAIFWGLAGLVLLTLGMRISRRPAT